MYVFEKLQFVIDYRFLTEWPLWVNKTSLKINKKDEKVAKSIIMDDKTTQKTYLTYLKIEKILWKLNKNIKPASLKKNILFIIIGLKCHYDVITNNKI